ncbi:MAG: HAMP domain-containing protein [Saprospiraceae bacterium]|jgi:PAS domain S-box-containing protein|nr:HAMP domain-containing protein [Saprospiraceae bacterium]MBK6477441.1 HAMP domain-containing protein [Saprospiraceae bacterium]MBK6816687.1 HAMP domain-containing protein [Saprospiraceae bacterium]MBK7436289.1 HAMP domain-containing protein [Saprospiraceae bacterium]MBK8281281.1 HAMP domain-containing protein [Saprospiraceae bacterium]
MKIKTKLYLGVGLLFLLIFILNIVATYYINALKSDTENIIAANYKSLQYSRNMLSALQQKNRYDLKKFEASLIKQENNITEMGEAEITNELRDNYEELKTNISDTLFLISIHNNLFQIMDMNMHAIERKSDKAKRTADEAVLWIAMTGTLCFLIAFILLVNLPSNIANPIRELTESIKQIAANNYAERVHFESHSEYGQLATSFNTMAVKLEEYNKSNLAKIMMEKKRIETLINNMHDPVIGLDNDLMIIFANEEAINISGLKRSEFIGKSAQELGIKNDLIRTLVQDLFNEENENLYKKRPIKIYAGNKESYFEKETLHISITPTGEKAQKLVGHVIFLRNVTAYKELDFAKTNFIATVSHEFKTPISSIKMSLQLMEKDQIGPLNDEQKNLLASIKEDADRLLNITGELLNMTQVESGNIQLSILPSDPKEILFYAINATRNVAEQKKIKLDIDCPEQISEVMVDNEKTAWVLINLISNAIRYSYEHATVFLSIRQTSHHIQIAIKDTGRGIAPQYKDKIFDRYFRVPGTEKEGTGLGLAISKEFIEAQGGQIMVDSELGVGSTFILTLLKAV